MSDKKVEFEVVRRGAKTKGEGHAVGSFVEIAGPVPAHLAGKLRRVGKEAELEVATPEPPAPPAPPKK